MQPNEFVNEDVITLFTGDLPKLWDIESRYPVEKPVCLNYKTVRDDIFDLSVMVRELRAKILRLEKPNYQCKIGRWNFSIRKADVYDKTRDIKVA